jgi:SAM-dependent methyltransferase
MQMSLSGTVRRMNWRLKAQIQNLIATLPTGVSYKIHYWLQRYFGGLRHPTPTSRLIAGTAICRRILACNETPGNKVFLEIGTGARLNLPIALWLSGASEIITVDVNPYLRAGLVAEDVRYIAGHTEEIAGLFDGLPWDAKRLGQLTDLARGKWRLAELMRMCCIRYIAPGDAASLPIPDQSVDYHVSYTVLEHVPVPALERILTEGNRVLKNDGLFIHTIDYSDHFAHSDTSICSINFLQYSDDAWERIAGNRYTYTNRLRVDDFEGLFRACDQDVIAIDSKIDQRSLDVLKDGSFALDGRFSGKPTQVLATINSWFVTRKRPQ